MLRQPRHAVLRAALAAILEIGFVEHHQRIEAGPLEQALDRSRGAQVPVGLFGLAMNTSRVSGVDRRRHGVEIVASGIGAVALERRHLDRLRAGLAVTSG